MAKSRTGSCGERSESSACLPLNFEAPPKFCNSRQKSSPDRLKPVPLIRIKPLFFPRIPVDVVAVLFPEAGFVLGRECKSAHPFHALPEIQVRHDQAQRIAMVGGKILAVMLKSENRRGLHQV